MAFGDGTTTRFVYVGPVITAADWRGSYVLYSTARTNFVRQSNTFDNSNWFKSGLAPAQTAVAPDGTTTAWTATASAADSYYKQQAVITGLTVGTTYCTSVWARVTSGTLTTWLIAADIGGTGFYQKSITLTTTWQRFYVAGILTAGSTVQTVQIGGSNTIGVGKVVEVWKAQKEARTLPTANIDTTTAAVAVTDYAVTGIYADFATAPAAGVPLLGVSSGPDTRIVRFGSMMGRMV